MGEKGCFVGAKQVLKWSVACAKVKSPRHIANTPYRFAIIALIASKSAIPSNEFPNMSSNSFYNG